MARNLFVLVSASSLALAAGAVDAQSSDDAESRPAERSTAHLLAEEIVVTGSRISRSRLDTLAPIDIITADSLTEQATPELGQALANVAPSINFPRPTVTDGTDHIRPAVLRGLAPDQTLVLLNGIRQHSSALVNVNGTLGRGSSAVDLNTIPIIALDRVEVLRDGASAQYGSDAIAGVVNLRLREAREGGGATLSGGLYVSRPRESRNPSGRKVRDGENVSIAAWQGLPLGGEGFVTLSGEYIKRDPTVRAGLDPRVTPQRVTARGGDPELETRTAFVNAGLPLGDRFDLYALAGYQNRYGESAGFFRVENNINNINLATGQPIVPGGFLPLIGIDVDDMTLGAGLRGDVGGFATDFGVRFGKNELDFSTLNSLNGSLGAASPRDFDAGRVSYDQLTATASAVRGFDVGLPRPLTVAFGAEHRREGYEIGAGELASYVYGPDRGGGRQPGAQLFPGFQPDNETDASRKSWSAFAEVDAALTERFEMALAARFEDYSDFGSTTNGKLSARFDVNDRFALRGTVSTGFRAPSLQQQFYRSTVPVFRVINGVSVPVDTQTFPVSDPVAIALGAKPLRPEDSTNLTAGIVYRSGGFELSLDAYQIKIDDRIVLSENILGQAPGTPGATPTQIAIDNLVNSAGSPVAYAGRRVFSNGVDTTTRGVDLVARYVLPTERYGRFDFTVAGSYNETEVDAVPTTEPLSQLPDPPSLFARTELLRFEEGNPKERLLVSTDWDSGGSVSATARVNWYASLLHALNDPAVDHETGSAAIVDLELRVKAGSNMTFSLGSNNVFDKYSRQFTAQRNAQGAIPYSNYTPWGVNGRQVYVRANISW